MNDGRVAAIDSTLRSVDLRSKVRQTM